MTIEEAQKAVDQWIKEYGVRYFSELTNMACLTEEVGELARVIARKYGDQSFKEGEKPDIGEEIADVLWVLLCLANQTGINLTEELQKSFEKKIGLPPEAEQQGSRYHAVPHQHPEEVLERGERVDADPVEDCGKGDEDDAPVHRCHEGCYRRIGECHPLVGKAVLLAGFRGSAARCCIGSRA